MRFKLQEMFSASYPNSSFTHVADQESAMFLVISPEEQDILNNLPGWHVNESEIIQPRSHEPLKPCKSIIEKTVNRMENTVKKVAVLKTSVDSSKKSVNYQTTNISVDERKLISALSEKPAVYFKKSKSLSDLKIDNMSQQKSFKAGLPSSGIENSRKFNDPYRDVRWCSCNSLTKLSRNRVNISPLTKFQSHLSKTKKKILELKKKTIQEDNELKKLQQKEESCKSKPNTILTNHFGNISEKIHITSSCNLKKNNNVQSDNDVASNSSSLLNEKTVSLPSLNKNIYNNTQKNDCLPEQSHKPCVIANSENGIIRQNVESDSQKLSSISQDLSEKYILNLMSKNNISPNMHPKNIKEGLQDVEIKNSNLKVDDKMLSNQISTSQSETSDSSALNATYTISHSNQKLALKYPGMQQEVEPSMYIIGEETQKACFGIINNLSNSWKTDSKLFDDRNDLIPSSISEKASQQDILSQENTDLENSTELFKDSQDSQVVNAFVQPATARRKLQFSPETPIPSVKKLKTSLDQFISPEIKILSNTEPTSSHIELPLLHSTDNLTPPKSLFTFEPNELKRMLDFVWDSNS